MNTSKILYNSNTTNKMIQEKIRKFKILKPILALFLISFVLLLSSCYVFIRTPRIHPAIIIEANIQQVSKKVPG
jgi:hypothetical protein